MISPYGYCVRERAGVLRDEGRDAYSRTDDENVILERYFHDIYAMFLDRLTRFAVEADTAEEDKRKLTRLLQELIKTRTLLENVQRGAREGK